VALAESFSTSPELQNVHVEIKNFGFDVSFDFLIYYFLDHA
jgi:hypothetical protein